MNKNIITLLVISSLVLSNIGPAFACGVDGRIYGGGSDYLSISSEIEAKIKPDELYISSYYSGTDNVNEKKETLEKELKDYGEIIQLNPYSYCYPNTECQNSLNLYFKVTNFSDSNKIMDILTNNGLTDNYLNPTVNDESLTQLELDNYDALITDLDTEKAPYEESLGAELTDMSSVNLYPIYDSTTFDGEYIPVTIHMDASYYIRNIES